MLMKFRSYFKLLSTGNATESSRALRKRRRFSTGLSTEFRHYDFI